jgi:hypothetical protein
LFRERLKLVARLFACSLALSRNLLLLQAVHVIDTGADLLEYVVIFLKITEHVPGYEADHAREAG